MLRKVYIQANVISQILEAGRTAPAMARVFLGIKHHKPFSGTIVLSTQKLRKLSSIIKMPYRSVKQNIDRLIKEGLLLPYEQDTLGMAYHVKSNKRKYEDEQGILRVELPNLFTILNSNVSTKTWLEAAFKANADSTYKKVRRMASNESLIPRHMSNSLWAYNADFGGWYPLTGVLQGGKVISLKDVKSLPRREIRSEMEVLDYNPISGGYLSSMSSLKEATHRGHRKRLRPYETTTRVTWLREFTDFKAYCQYAYLLEDTPEIRGKVHCGETVKWSKTKNGKWSQGKVYYAAFEIAAHTVCHLEVKQARIDRATKKAMNKKRNRWGFFSPVDRHCELKGITKKEFVEQHTQRATLEGRMLAARTANIIKRENGKNIPTPKEIYEYNHFDDYMEPSLESLAKSFPTADFSLF